MIVRRRVEAYHRTGMNKWMPPGEDFLVVAVFFPFHGRPSARVLNYWDRAGIMDFDELDVVDAGIPSSWTVRVLDDEVVIQPEAWQHPAWWTVWADEPHPQAAELWAIHEGNLRPSFLREVRRMRHDCWFVDGRTRSVGHRPPPVLPFSAVFESLPPGNEAGSDEEPRRLH